MSSLAREERNRADYPDYQAGVLAYLAGQTENFLRARQLPSLSKVEKVLLEARSLFGKQNWNEAIDILARTPTVSGSFFEAERFFLLGTAYFFIGDLETAVIRCHSAEEIYQKLQDRRGQFLCQHNLMVYFSRLGLGKLAKSYFEMASAIASGNSEKMLMTRARSCELSREGRFEEAAQWMDRTLEHAGPPHGPDGHSLGVIAADIFFRANQIEKAHSLLLGLKGERSSNHERGRLDFEFGILSSLRDRKSLGSPPPSLENFQEYRLKWGLIVAMQGGDMDLARRYWKELRAIFPALFGEAFVCLDDSEKRTPFWTYVETLSQKNKAQAFQISLSGKVKVLFELLKNSSTPLGKEFLIEKIWRTSYSPEYDARLYKLVERARMSGVPISNLNRAYLISGS